MKGRGLTEDHIQAYSISYSCAHNVFVLFLIPCKELAVALSLSNIIG